MISGTLISPLLLGILILGTLISPSIFWALISIFDKSIFGSTLGISIFVTPTFGIFPSIFGALISTFGISIFGLFISISIFGILISLSFLGILILGIFNFPFGILTPTLTSGINKLCLFNIIGSSTLPLNIVLIFNG